MTIPQVLQADFLEITQLIFAVLERAVQKVNTELIDLYWQMSPTLRQKIALLQGKLQELYLQNAPGDDAPDDL